MPLKSLRNREVRARLLAAGFKEVSQAGGVVKFARRSEVGLRTAIVPHHTEVAVGTIRSILRQAGISESEWNAL